MMKILPYSPMEGRHRYEDDITDEIILIPPGINISITIVPVASAILSYSTSSVTSIQNDEAIWVEEETVSATKTLSSKYPISAIRIVGAAHVTVIGEG